MSVGLKQQAVCRNGKDKRRDRVHTPIRSHASSDDAAEVNFGYKP
jgi:hypothetical protein